mmetsp:Transcript_8146/g.30528  ORF Transcript_8146/g.30528 Transcript_8146/m.30528 type:complete len:200 (+) Transcript_8146:2175-2774(+)
MAAVFGCSRSRFGFGFVFVFVVVSVFIIRPLPAVPLVPLEPRKRADQRFFRAQRRVTCIGEGTIRAIGVAPEPTNRGGALRRRGIKAPAVSVLRRFQIGIGRHLSEIIAVDTRGGLYPHTVLRGQRRARRLPGFRNRSARRRTSSGGFLFRIGVLSFGKSRFGVSRSRAPSPSRDLHLRVDHRTRGDAVELQSGIHLVP